MTEKELNRVRDLKRKIRELNQKLQELKISAENIVPILDGLPHSKNAKSRVEKIALMIAEAEEELVRLREEMIQAKASLADKIISQVEEPALQTLLILRYIECLSFKETARRMHFGLRYVFKIHERFLKEGICGHIDAQNHN